MDAGALSDGGLRITHLVIAGNEQGNRGETRFDYGFQT